MEKKIFRIEGYILKGNKKMKFSKEIVEVKKEYAIEKLYSIFGGLYRVKRSKIKIENVTVISPEESKDPYIKQLFYLQQ